MDPVVLDTSRYLSDLDRATAAEEREWDAEAASLVELAPAVDVEASEEAHEVVVEGIMDGSIEPPKHPALEAWRRAA